MVELGLDFGLKYRTADPLTALADYLPMKAHPMASRSQRVQSRFELCLRAVEPAAIALLCELVHWVSGNDLQEFAMYADSYTSSINIRLPSAQMQERILMR